MTKMGRLDEVQRHRALGMVEGGLSFHEVGRGMGCSHQTIMKLVERNANTGSLCDRQCPGRQRVKSRQQDQHVFLTLLRDTFKTSVQTAQKTLGIHNQCVSASTVRRRLCERDIGNFKAYRGNVLTDASTLAELQRLVQATSLVDTTSVAKCYVYWQVTVLYWYAWRTCKSLAIVASGSLLVGAVWGGISWRYRIPLVVTDGNLTARRYIDKVLQQVVFAVSQESCRNVLSTKQCKTSFSQTYQGLSRPK